MPLYLTEDDVSALLPMTTAVEGVEEAFRQLGEGKATNQPRRRARFPGGALHVMFAAQPESGYLGVKAYTTVAGQARFHLLLYAAGSGELLALMEANRLGQLRTGAATGVATRYLARDDVRVAAVIGTGFQARTQVEALCVARHWDEIRCYGRDPERRRAFSEELSARLGVWVVPKDSPEAAVEDADVVTTMTSAAAPVFHAEWLRPGMHLNVTGSNSLLKAEVDAATVARADRVVVDARDAVPLESGDLLRPLEIGSLLPEALVELGAVVAGRAPGRTNAEEITLFKSHGLAIEDIAVAGFVYEAALAASRGQPLPA